MLRIIKVTGQSLLPEFKEGDYVVLTTLPFFFDSLKAGDIIVFKHPVHGIMIKKVDQVHAQVDEISVIGSHPESTDSRRFGPIPKSWVMGKMIWHITKSG